MKKIIFLSVLIAGNSWSVCNKTVNQKKVVVFIDANNSPAEVKDAEKAACERGEAFKKIPPDGKHINAAGLQVELKKLADANKAVSSMVISGHDGGGNIHGEKGGVDKYEVISAMKGAYKNKPALLSEFKSVFMWGCWTMGPSEVDVWRKELPSLKMCSGFFDMGPLNTTLASRAVLHDLLVKEKSMVEEADQKKLKRIIASVEHINQTYAAVYTEASCGDMYYYNTQGIKHEGAENADNVNYTAGNHYVNYNEKFDCKHAAADIEKNRKELIKYFYGSLPLPPNNANSPILKIYSFLRSHANCLKDNHILNGDRVGMLRFYDSVKDNFAEVFSEVIIDAGAEFKKLEVLSKIFKPQTTALKDFTKYLQDGKASFFNCDSATLKTKSRKDIMKMIAYLDGLKKQPFAKDKNVAPKLANLKKLKNAMENYLFQLNPNCMDFLDWHEHTPGRKPWTGCPI
jgi:hypothetical protein